MNQEPKNPGKETKILFLNSWFPDFISM